MEWRIEARQKSVAGIGGHNYLALVGPDGKVHSEIHGDHGPNGSLVRVGRMLNPEVVGASQPVMVGAADQIDAAWNQMLRHANHLSGKAVYGLLAPNSNAFWATILRQSGFDYRQHKPNSDLPTPGVDVDLGDPLWWTPEHRWPGASTPNGSEQGIPADRLP